MMRSRSIISVLLAGALLGWAADAGAGLLGAGAARDALLASAAGFVMAAVWSYTGRALLISAGIAAVPLGLLLAHLTVTSATLSSSNGLALHESLTSGPGVQALFLLGVGTFWTGVFYGWLALHKGEVWAAVAIAGGAYLLAADVDLTSADLFPAFVALAFMLVVWTYGRASLSETIGPPVVAAMLAIGVLILSWHSPAADPAWSRTFVDPLTSAVGQGGAFSVSDVLDLSGPFRPSNQVIMSISMAWPSLRPYWRAAVFDHFDGRSWHSSEKFIRPLDPNASIPTGSARSQGSTISLAVTVYRPTQEIVAPGPVLRVDRPTVAVYGIDSSAPIAVRTQQVLNGGSAYRVEASVSGSSSGGLNRASSDAMRVYLQLPPEPARVRDLAERLVRGQSSALHRALAIERYLHDNPAFRYDSSAGSPTDRDAVDDFLFQARRGYCAQFASAMVVLAREAGIPARLVSGYTTGSFEHGTFLLRGRDAHSWAEAYLAGSGWVSFEPTPGFALDSSVAPGSRGVGAAVAPKVAPRVLTRPIDASQRKRLHLKGLSSGTTTQSRRGGSRVAGPGALMSAVILLLLVSAYVVFRYWPRSLERIYRSMAHGAARRGRRIRQGETPAEFAREWADDGPAFADADLIARLYARQQYGGVGPSAEELRQAREAWRRLRKRWVG